MIKKVKLVWRIEADKPSLNVQYVLHADIASMSFSFRCPTEHWNYWLVTGIDYHADEQQHEGQTQTPQCALRPGGKCYCDGSSLSADELWKEFIECKMDEQVIWDRLAEWMNSRFPTAK